MNEEFLKDILFDMMGYAEEQKEQAERAAELMRTIGGWEDYDHDMLHGVVEKYPMTCRLAAKLETNFFKTFFDGLQTYCMFLKSAPESLRIIGTKKFVAQMKCVHHEIEKAINDKEVQQ